MRGTPSEGVGCLEAHGVQGGEVGPICEHREVRLTGIVLCLLEVSSIVPEIWTENLH